MANDEVNKSGVAFWTFMTLVSLATFIYILIWSFQNNNAKGIAIGSIFSVMIFSGLIFALFSSVFKNKFSGTFFDSSSWGDNSLSFMIGFALWLGLGSLTVLQSVVGLPKQYLFAAISSELPQILEFSVNGILVPIAEEVFWIIAIPFAITFIMNSIGKDDSWVRNKWVQIGVITVVGGLTFAFFHVGATAITAFIFIAIFFRAFMIITIYSDQYFDWLKKVNLVPAFAIGAHMANNLSTYGFQQIKLIMTSNFYPVGLLIIIFLLIIFVSGVDKILSLIFGDEKTVKVSSS